MAVTTTETDASARNSNEQQQQVANTAGSSETNLSSESPVAAEKADPPADTRSIRGVKWVLVVIAILSSTFLFSLDNTVVADIQPTITEQFPGAIDRLPWVSVGYLLGSATTNLLWGQIYSQLDGKWVYIFSVVLFEIGSVICGAAPTMDALVVGRVICGLGGAGLYTGVMVLFSVNTSEKERPTYFGLTGISWGSGTCLGPIIGGAFADSAATWRWAFYINLVVGGICAPVYLFFIPSADPHPGKKFFRRLREVDWIGATLIAAFFLTGLMAITFGGTVYAWNSGQIIALFVCFGVFGAAFFLQQIYLIGTTHERRLFPVEYLSNPFMVNMFLQTAAGTTSVFIPVYFIPLYFAFIQGDSALMAGVRLLPFVVPLAVVCTVAGYAMSYFGYYAPWYLFGGICCLTGSSLLYTITENTYFGSIYGYSALVGIGAGAYIQASFSVGQMKAPPHLAKYVVGVLTTAQLGGPAFAMSIANAVFLNDALADLSALLPGESRDYILSVVSGAARSEAGRLPNRDAVLAALTVVLRRSFILPMTAAAMTILLALTMKWEKLFGAAPPKDEESKGTGGVKASADDSAEAERKEVAA